MEPEISPRRSTANLLFPVTPARGAASHAAMPEISSILSHLPSDAGVLRRELESLARERDPELRGEGLLALARRQEAEGRLEMAAELYAAVVREAGAVGAVSPLAGDGREAPPRTRAQAGLDAILGRGSVGPRAEFLLRNLAQQAADPALLFAMGAAGAVFRMTRVVTLSRLASTPNPGFMTQLLGAGRLASLTGFALEAPAFTLAARLGNEALGRSQDWSGRVLGRDVASSYLVLGGLKLGGWASQATYRRLANPVPGWRSGAGGAPGSPLQLLFQQGGMLTGILLGHSLEERFGLRPRHDGATTLTDSLALLLQFHVAGRLSHHAFGPRFAAWESNLDLRAETLAGPLRPPRFGPLLEGPASNGLAGRRLAVAASGAEGEGRFPQILQMSADRPGGKGEDSLRTLPFVNPEGLGISPLEIQHPMQLGRRILDPRLKFEELLQKGDVVFQITSRTFDIEPYLPSLLRHLNRMVQNQGGAIPIGRKVILNLSGEGGATAARILLLRGVRGFERFSEPTRAEAPAPPSRRAAAYAPTLLAIPIESVAAAPAAPPKPPRPIPWIALAPEEIPGLLRRLAEGLEPGRKPPALILEDLPWSDAELNQLTRGMGKEFPAELNFEIFLPAAETTVQGIVLGENLHWLNQFRVNLEWKRLESRAAKDPLVVEGVEQLYQQIYYFARLDPATAPAERTLRLAAAPPEGPLPEFVRRALNKYRVPGARLRLEFEGGEAPMQFLGQGGVWAYLAEPPPRGPETAPAEAVPPGPKDAVERLPDYRIARWRGDLGEFLQGIRAEGEGPQLHEFLLELPLPLQSGDLNLLQQKVQALPEGHRVRLHDRPGRRVYTLQRRGEGVAVEEQPWDTSLAWRAQGENPRYALEAGHVIDLLRQLPLVEAPEPGSGAPLRVLMQGPWLPQAHGAMLWESLPRWLDFPYREVELHYFRAPAGEGSGWARQYFRRDPLGQWRVREEE